MNRAVIVFMACLLGGVVMAQEGQNVTGELKKEEAWTGEGVPMVIKLRSPGPFSGTAAFDLLEVSKTAFLKFGNPVVGNEEVEGKSFFTQTHQFSVYSQQEGKVVIPSFLVRFSGKKDFTSEAEAMEGKTPELTFQSKRPEGTEGIVVVVTVTGMKVSQTWSSS